MADLNLRLIFPRGTSNFFYKLTSLMCLLQSVFCALWATDFSSLALETEHPILWMSLLLLLIIINFLMLFHIINVVSTIRSVTHRSIDILNEVCEEAREHRNVEDNLREAITEQLKFIELPEAAWEDHVYRGFEEADMHGKGSRYLSCNILTTNALAAVLKPHIPPGHTIGAGVASTVCILTEISFDS